MPEINNRSIRTGGAAPMAEASLAISEMISFGRGRGGRFTEFNNATNCLEESGGKLHHLRPSGICQAIGDEFRLHPMRFTLNVVVPHILAHPNWHFGFQERISDPNDKPLLLGLIQ